MRPAVQGPPGFSVRKAPRPHLWLRAFILMQATGAKPQFDHRKGRSRSCPWHRAAV